MEEWIRLNNELIGSSEVLAVLNTMLNEWSYHPDRDFHAIMKRYYWAEQEKQERLHKEIKKLATENYGKKGIQTK